MSSGTKCINGEQISLEGCVINDSHSEVVSRRCLVLFMMRQLELLMAEIQENGNKEEAKEATEVEEKGKEKNVLTDRESIFQISNDGEEGTYE